MKTNFQASKFATIKYKSVNTTIWPIQYLNAQNGHFHNMQMQNGCTEYNVVGFFEVHWLQNHENIYTIPDERDGQQN